MKKSAKLLIFCLSILAFDALSEEGKYYVELSAGVSNGYVPYGGELPSGRYGSAGVYSFALGKQFNDRIAFDVELSHRGDYTNNDDSYTTNEGVHNVSISIYSLATMLNGYYYYYDKNIDFKPYVTGGAGLSRNKTSNATTAGIDTEKEQRSQITSGKSATSFAWKLGTGVKYKLDSRFEADFRYQFVDLGSAKVSNTTSCYNNGSYIGSTIEAAKSSKLKTHEFLVGVIYKF